MGLGDQLIATGLARGAHARGKRIAFGERNVIRWDQNSAQIFLNNPNIAPPGSERANDLEWIAYYKGQRLYNRQQGNRWVWNLDWRCKPGEIFFDETEKAAGMRYGSGFILIEPNVPNHKTARFNKQWPIERFQEVAEKLVGAGLEVLQPVYRGAAHRLVGVKQIETRSFRDMLAVMANASVFIGPEGGLHHGAAAVGIPAVVIFGGFIPPEVTGYEGHINLTGGSEAACGNLNPCQHCQLVMQRISVDQVYNSARTLLERKAA